MDKIGLNDYIMEIFQDFVELESMLKVLKNSAYNGDNEISMTDVGNALEIMTAKIVNTKNSLNKYIDNAFG